MQAAHDEVLRALGSPDEEVRRRAVERLAALPEGEGVQALVERLGDTSWRVRKAAVEGLVGGPRPDAAVRALVRALGDGDNPGRRNAALETLTRCGRAALGPLLEATGDADVDVRKQAVDALAGLGDLAAGPRLCELLADPDPNVRGAAADALGALGDDARAPELLRIAASDREVLVRLSALRALSRLEADCRVEALEEPLADPVLRPAALALLGASADPEAEPLLRKALEEERRAVREAAMEALVRQAGRRDGPELLRLAARVREAVRARPDLVAAASDRLKGAPLPARLVVVQFLALARDPASVVPLLEAGTDEALAEVVVESLVGYGADAARAVDAAWDGLEAPLRVLACRVLGRLEEGAGAERLRAALGDAEPGVRAAAARALGRRGFAPALGELVAQLEAASLREDEVGEEVASAVAEGLVDLARSEGELAGRALELLIGRVEGAGELFRLAVARIFGAVAGEGDIPRLGLLMADPSAAVRRAAVEAVARLSRGGVPEALRLALADEAASVRIGAAAALAETGEAEALGDLAALAGDEDERVRAAAMRAVGTWTSRRGAPHGDATVDALLGEGLSETGPVALAALEALSLRGGPSAVGMARRLLTAAEPELVQGALACVGAHGGAQDLTDLVALASHPDWTVRAQAVQVLGERGFEPALPALRRRRETEQDEFVRDALDRALERLEVAESR